MKYDLLDWLFAPMNFLSWLLSEVEDDLVLLAFIVLLMVPVMMAQVIWMMVFMLTLIPVSLAWTFIYKPIAFVIRGAIRLSRPTPTTKRGTSRTT